MQVELNSREEAIEWFKQNYKTYYPTSYLDELRVDGMFTIMHGGSQRGPVHKKITHPGLKFPIKFTPGDGIKDEHFFKWYKPNENLNYMAILFKELNKIAMLKISRR